MSASHQQQHCDCFFSIIQYCWSHQLHTLFIIHAWTLIILDHCHAARISYFVSHQEMIMINLTFLSKPMQAFYH